MGKKIISFLGTGNYYNVKYKFIDYNNKTKIIETRFIQEVIPKIVGEDAILYIGLTAGDKGSRKKNWESSTKELLDFNNIPKKEANSKGLKEILDEKDVMYRELDLKDGSNEDEIWENFDRIFNVLEYGDEVYIDITHSFRSLPIIIMSIINYAKFIKNITIKGIYYGAYEAKGEDNIAPIFDLSLFDTITDWTIAAEKFINSGNSKDLVKQIDKVLSPRLKSSKGKDKDANMLKNLKIKLNNFSKGLYNIRGQIITKNALELKEQLKEIEEISIDQLKPFERILKTIEKIVEPYSLNEIINIHYTVKLLAKFELIQQAYTLLQENIINYLIYKGNLKDYYKDATIRGYVKDILYENGTGKIKDTIGLNKEQITFINEVRNSINKYCLYDIYILYDDIGKYRNDLNHAGYRQDAKNKDNKFENKIDKFIGKFEEVLDLPNNLEVKNVDKSKDKKELNPKMILIFSHELADKQIEDAKESLNIDKFISLPDKLQRTWSSISPEKEDISEILHDIKMFIKNEASKGDYILVQGDFGATYQIVNFSKQLGLKPIYSTTNRRAKEIKRDDGKIELIHIFEHIRYRYY